VPPPAELPTDLDALADPSERPEATLANADADVGVDRALRDARALLALRRRAAELPGRRTALAWPGFAALLDAALPSDDSGLAAIAAAIALPASTLRELRRGDVLAAEVRVQPIQLLAEALQLEPEVLLALVRADVETAGRTGDLLDLSELEDAVRGLSSPERGAT
jgi:hypothetical protein